MDLITTILLAIIAITTVIFLVRKKIVRLMSKGIKVLFAVFLFIGLISLFVPQVYSSLSDNTLKSIGTYKTITDMDKGLSLDSVKNAPQNLLDSLKNLFNPQDNQTDNQTSQTTAPQVGFLEGSIYAGLVTLIAFIYRIVGIAISIGGLILLT